MIALNAMSQLNFKEEKTMKRSALLLIPLVLSFASCGKSDPNLDPGIVIIPNQEVVNKVKEILNNQDLSNFYSKTLRVMYSQQYDVLDVYREDGESVTNFFSYVGDGILGIYHDLTSEQYDSVVDEEGNIDIFDAISVGKAYYGIFQIVRTTSFSRENTSESKVQNLDIAQSLALKTNSENLWLNNSLDVTDEGVFNAEYTQRFNSSINKELLFSNISTRSFREIISKTNIFDAPGNLEHLDKLYYSTCRELVSKSDKEISDFIIENQISVKEEDDIEVSFVYRNEIADEDDEEYIFPGEIKGTLFFDKETYKFTNFIYEIPYTIETHDEESGNTKLVSTSFYAEGESYRGLPSDPWEPIDPVVYDDVAEYLKDVNEQVIPPEIYL